MEATPAKSNDLERRIDLSIAIADVEKDLDERLKRLGRNVKMPGFRPGKVPFSIVKQQHGPQARNEVLSEALDGAFVEAVTAQNFRVAGYPRIEAKATDSTTHLEFTAIFEVYPEFTPGDLSDAEIERPTLEVSAAEIDQTLDILRKQRVHYHTKGEAGEHGTGGEAVAANGDRVTVDFVGKIDGEAFAGGSAKGTPLVLGSGRMIPGFEEALVGVKAGEERVINPTFPADYQNLDLAGKTAEFTVTVNSVSAPQLPELNDDFFDLFGIKEGGLEGFRAEVRKNMERELRQAIKSKVKNQVMEGLVTTNPIEVPKALIDNEVNRLRVQAIQQFGGNIKPEQLPAEMFEEQAKRRVVLGPIVAEVVKQGELKADEARVRELIEEMASAYQEPQQVVAWYYKNDQQLNEVRSVVLEEQVVDTVLQKAKVTDKAVSYEEAVKPAEAPQAA